MAILEFPNVQNADDEGLIALGGDLELPSLILAYKNGIFPWPISKEYPLAWFSPNPRGILKCDNIHISKSMKKILKQNRFEVRFNTSFSEVIENCASIKRDDDQGTWITDDIIKAYTNLFEAGYAYSVESYNASNSLVGGIYGICLGHIITGESMFFKESNASKVALIKLIQYLKLKGVKLLDTQMITPIVKNLGGSVMKRDDFIKFLKQIDKKHGGKKLFMDCDRALLL